MSSRKTIPEPTLQETAAPGPEPPGGPTNAAKPEARPAAREARTENNNSEDPESLCKKGGCVASGAARVDSRGGVAAAVGRGEQSAGGRQNSRRAGKADGEASGRKALGTLGCEASPLMAASHHDNMSK